MKQFLAVFISLFLVTVHGAPHIISYSAPFAPVVVAPASSQWHSQDSLGQYAYGYSGGPSAKSEVRSLDGITSGSYSYIDPENKLQTVNYVSDALGFRVAATNLPSAPVDNNQPPQPVEDTPEVKQAREDHLKAVKEAENNSGSDDSKTEVITAEAPQPVEDTVEVKLAKQEHQKAYDSAAALAAARPENDGSQEINTVVLPQTIAYHASPYIAHHPIAYSSQYIAAAPFVKTIVPSSFSYSIHSAPQVIAQNYPYVIAA